MSGFVKEVTPRMQALHIVSEGLSFPWQCGLPMCP